MFEVGSISFLVVRSSCPKAQSSCCEQHNLLPTAICLLLTYGPRRSSSGVEQLTRNEQVRGSNPRSGSTPGQVAGVNSANNAANTSWGRWFACSSVTAFNTLSALATAASGLIIASVAAGIS